MPSTSAAAAAASVHDPINVPIPREANDDYILPQAEEDKEADGNHQDGDEGHDHGKDGGEDDNNNDKEDDDNDDNDDNEGNEYKEEEDKDGDDNHLIRGFCLILILIETSIRRKIRLIEGNEKCRHLKN